MNDEGAPGVMSAQNGSVRTLRSDLGSLRTAAATRPGKSLAAVAALLCTLLTFGAGTVGWIEGSDPLTAHGTTAQFPALPAAASESAGGQDEVAQPRLRVPTLDINAPIVPIALRDDGRLDPPADVDDVGWWDRSAGAGGQRGQTVLTGHTVHKGGGVMDDLEELAAGDAVQITDDGKYVDYRVTRVVTLSKAQLAEQAVAVFGQDRQHGRLVIVTCERWNGDSFDENIVAFAEPVPPPANLRASRTRMSS